MRFLKWLHWVAVVLFVACVIGCGRGEPTEAELKAIEEGARRAVADKLEADFGVSPKKAEPSKEDREFKEANDIMERVRPMINVPDGIDGVEWCLAQINLWEEYDRRNRRKADGYLSAARNLSAARWLKAELLDRTPADVVARWGMIRSQLRLETESQEDQ